MWQENDLVPAAPADKPFIQRQLVTKAASSRKNVCDSLCNDDATVANIQRALKLKSKFCNVRDRAWRVEEALWSTLTGIGATERVHACIVEAIRPSGSAAHTLALATARLKRFGESPILKFAGAQAQGVHKTVTDWMDALAGRQCPKFSKASSSSQFVATVKDAMGTLLQEPAQINKEEVVVTGSRAAQERFKKLESQQDNGSNLDYARVMELRSFSFLLSSEQRTKVDAMVKKCVATSNVGAVVAAELTKKTKSKDGIDTKKLVKGLFSKR